MKCQKIIDLWKGINSRDDLKKFIPPPWEIVNFVGYEEARKRARTTTNGCRILSPAQALCAVADDVNIPCKELLRCLDEAIWQAKCPDDGEAGHVGETR